MLEVCLFGELFELFSSFYFDQIIFPKGKIPIFYNPHFPGATEFFLFPGFLKSVFAFKKGKKGDLAIFIKSLCSLGARPWCLMLTLSLARPKKLVLARSSSNVHSTHHYYVLYCTFNFLVLHKPLIHDQISKVIFPYAHLWSDIRGSMYRCLLEFCRLQYRCNLQNSSRHTVDCRPNARPCICRYSKCLGQWHFLIRLCICTT